MGAAVLMALLVLVQQGFMYKARQGLEMYTFRQALYMSKSTGRGIDLTVMRDIVTPSFFAGLSRDRLQASASIEANSWDLYTASAKDPSTGAGDDSPQDIPTYQLLQVGEAMIQNGHFLQIPLTRMKVETKDGKGKDWSWKTSSIRELDAQNVGTDDSNRSTEYNYAKTNREVSTGNTMKSIHSNTYDSQEKNYVKITFQPADEIKEDYKKNDWEDNIESEAKVSVHDIPADAGVMLDEKLRRIRSTTTTN